MAERESPDPWDEKALAAAVRRLVRMGKEEVAVALLDCSVKVSLWDQSPERDWETYRVDISVPEASFDLLRDAVEEPYYASKLLDAVFSDVIPSDCSAFVRVQMRLDEVEAGWREAAYAALARGERNQGNLVFQGSIIHNGLRYKSYSEVVVARELDSRGVLFFPLPAASRGGVVREPDLLVIYRGRAGILEIHGAPYHPATRAAADHKRNLFFEESGIRTYVFDAKEARSNPKLIVDKFLALLSPPSR